jgi:hypothetical protein
MYLDLNVSSLAPAPQICAVGIPWAPRQLLPLPNISRSRSELLFGCDILRSTLDRWSNTWTTSPLHFKLPGSQCAAHLATETDRWQFIMQRMLRKCDPSWWQPTEKRPRYFYFLKRKIHRYSLTTFEMCITSTDMHIHLIFLLYQQELGLQNSLQDSKLVWPPILSSLYVYNMQSSEI